MKTISRILAVATTALLITACSQQQARKPISQTSGTFMKESITRNKKLIAGEEAVIDSIVKSNPSTVYIPSQKGYWYYYVTKNTTADTLKPKKGDVAYFEYNVKDIKGNVIYSEVELKPQEYHVDKQNIMMGMRDGIKLMKKKETVTFLFPSHMGYGYHGDNNRIGPNIPLICTITLTDFRPETVTKPVAPKPQIAQPEPTNPEPTKQ